jgi:DNA-nicking Smr family endonuclease
MLAFTFRHHKIVAMRRRPGSLTDHDSAAWAAYVQAVQPLHGRAKPAPPSPPPTPPEAPAPTAPATAPRRRAPLPGLVTGTQPPGLDTASWTRFRGGQMPPARTLDLHGKTVQAAHQALERFLLAAHADQLRCVEIITGRGSGEAGGAIRRELPHWLSLPALRPLILAAAYPHARNEGATRILLRRRR